MKILIFCLFFFSGSAAFCQTPGFKEENLIHRWVLDSAFQNGVKLKPRSIHTSLEFLQDHRVITSDTINSPQPHQWKFDPLKNELTLLYPDVDEPGKLLVKSLTETNLILEAFDEVENNHVVLYLRTDDIHR